MSVLSCYSPIPRPLEFLEFWILTAITLIAGDDIFSSVGYSGSRDLRVLTSSPDPSYTE